MWDFVVFYVLFQNSSEPEIRGGSVDALIVYAATVGVKGTRALIIVAYKLVSLPISVIFNYGT